MEAKLCQHCNRNKAGRPRGLCAGCFGDRDIRAGYEPKCPGYPDQTIPEPDELPAPTKTVPGTSARVTALQGRFANGKALKRNSGRAGSRDMTIEEVSLELERLRAFADAFAVHEIGLMPRRESPCGEVIWFARGIGLPLDQVWDVDPVEAMRKAVESMDDDPLLEDA